MVGFGSGNDFASSAVLFATLVQCHMITDVHHHEIVGLVIQLVAILMVYDRFLIVLESFHPCQCDVYVDRIGSKELVGPTAITFSKGFLVSEANPTHVGGKNFRSWHSLPLLAFQVFVYHVAYVVMFAYFISFEKPEEGEMGGSEREREREGGRERMEREGERYLCKQYRDTG